jgi:FkbM family methyltransferase
MKLISQFREFLKKFEIIRAAARMYYDWRFLLSLPPNVRHRCRKLLPCSESQLHQDILVLALLQFKEAGWFVEFGAANGVHFSNSYLLEKMFRWTGVLAEPAKMWHSSLMTNRNAKLEKDCVWRVSGEDLLFREVENGELSTLDEFAESDFHGAERECGKTYTVKTISLLDLLERHGAPYVIDYLSIDTEGSEYDILSAFNFSKYSFRVITCEHNYGASREKIRDLLEGKGYKRICVGVSRFDDWYVLPDRVSSLGNG